MTSSAATAADVSQKRAKRLKPAITAHHVCLLPLMQDKTIIADARFSFNAKRMETKENPVSEQLRISVSAAYGTCPIDNTEKKLYNDNCSSGYVQFITDGNGCLCIRSP